MYLLSFLWPQKAQPFVPSTPAGHYVPLNTRHLPRLVHPVSPGASVPSPPLFSELDLVLPLFDSWGYF